MRLLLSVVSSASVAIPAEQYSASINHGLLIYVGISHDDIPVADEKIAHIVGKLRSLQLFHVNGKLQGSLDTVEGGILLISNFTLYGDQKKGNRFDFTASAWFADAEKVYEKLVDALWAAGYTDLQTGKFGAMMNVESINEGPINLVWEV
jgi:D-aminoacyl-tRNA deacylase